MMNGGYLMVSKTDTNLYGKLNNALTSGKPILWYEDKNTCYYIDTITKSGTDIILTKGGKTITIENDGDITESGDIENPTLETIKDKNGNLRFIEGNLVLSEIVGLHISYNKWSLSGTHLMVVIAGTIDNGTTMSGTIVGETTLPSFIKDKIVPVIPNIVETKTTNAWGSDYSNELLYANFDKTNEGIRVAFTITATADRTFRIQFDLLIDNE